MKHAAAPGRRARRCTTRTLLALALLACGSVFATVGWAGRVWRGGRQLGARGAGGVAGERNTRIKQTAVVVAPPPLSAQSMTTASLSPAVTATATAASSSSEASSGGGGATLISSRAPKPSADLSQPPLLSLLPLLPLHIPQPPPPLPPPAASSTAPSTIPSPAPSSAPSFAVYRMLGRGVLITRARTTLISSSSSARLYDHSP